MPQNLYFHLPTSLLGLLASVLLAPTTASPAPAPGSVQVQTITITAPPSIASTAPQFTDTARFTSAILNSTNFFRSEHNASAVIWNHTLSTYASSYLASMGSESPDSGSECDFSHSGGPYGENLALGCNEVTGCVDLWGDEREQYNYDDPAFSEETGHFTQLVWKNTTAVGCGSRLCGTRGWYLVCEYWPRGNIIGQFDEQVGRQVSGTGSSGTADGAPGDNGMWSHAARNGPPPWLFYLITLSFLGLW
ncbi:Cell wall protein PRY3 [Diaporthe amygdali]|uniref:Cell wall protein PRY3 n=1 Tax=Phomopsis amygdali TaxID=1214568 RepID=UPI0022FE8B87|nr:Cell wall protein PRY3 [Diaporthe amygdali]KAJ0119649.1 Cell wall protein PRY3 [Diaporthe amygdali]